PGLRSCPRQRAHGAHRAIAAGQGWAARRVNRTRSRPAPSRSVRRSEMIPVLLLLLAVVAVYLGAIETAFSALMRLSLRLSAERSDRPDSLTDYLDDPIVLFLPVRLLLGLTTAATSALLAGEIGVSSMRLIAVVIFCVIAFVMSFELLIPILVARNNPERVLDL